MYQETNFNSVITKLFVFIDRQSKSKYYPLKLILCITLLVVCLATPAYHYLGVAFQDINWQAVMLKSSNLLDPLHEVPQGSHAAKKVFRLTVPFFIKIFSLTPLTVYILQGLLGIFSFYLIYRITLNISSDVVISTIVTFGLGFLYFGRAAFVDIYSWFDAWAYFFLLCAILSKHPILVLLFATGAAWADERAVMILPIVLLYHQISNFNSEKFSAIKNYLKLNFKAISVAVAILFYLVARFLMYSYLNMSTPSENAGFMRIFQQTDFWGFGVWSFLEGFWLVVILTLATTFYHKNYVIFFISFIFIILFSVIANIVNDITRSGSYLVPLLFVMILYLIRHYNQEMIRKLILIATTVTFLFPAYYIITDVKPYILWYKPIFVRFIDFLVLNNYI